MNIIDGIAYAEAQKPILKAKSVQPLTGHRMNVSFNTGEDDHV